MTTPTHQNLGPVADTYARFGVTLVRGEGPWVWAEDGTRYLDFTAGIAVCNLGHCNPAVTAAVAAQARELVHVSNLYWTRPQIDVARLLTAHSFADRVFFCNSGAEAVEAAVKLARRYGRNTRGPDCYEVICLENSFHGRTLATVTATGQSVYKKDFGPLPAGFLHVPATDVRALEMAAGARTAAILLEPVQGEGGVRPVPHDFLRAAREICTRLGALLIFDEVQVGMGRTGTLFAYEQTPVVPDVMCLAKALGNGLPIGAMLALEDVAAHLTPGSHASTFGGNPVVCAAARVVLETLTAPGFLDRVREVGVALRQGLEMLARQREEIVAEVRGMGLIQALEFRTPLPDLAQRMLDAGVMVLVGQGRVLRLVPPLTVGEAEVDVFLKTLAAVL